MAGVLAIGLVLTALPPAGQSVGAGVVTVAQIRRLHDLGRTGWWVAAILGLQIVAAIGLVTAGLPEDTIYLIAGLTTVAAPIILLGALPGEAHENRFGPQPGGRSLKDIFN